MPGVSPGVISHHLSVSKAKKPIQQKRRAFSDEKNRTIEEEVQKLLEAGFIEPCKYPEWLANVVMVKKANGSWRPGLSEPERKKYESIRG